MSEESRMKKTIIRIAVCVVVFLASALIIGSIMNQGHNNMTMEMAPATLPMITMESGGDRKRNYGDLDRGSQHRRQPADREQ